MKPELKKRWVDALRSGKYLQIKERLRDEIGFCCLGVACEVFKNDVGLKIGLPTSKTSYYFSYDECGSSLPNKLQDLLGLTCTGSLETSVHGAKDLVNLNDKVGYTFSQIADVIEEQF